MPSACGNQLILGAAKLKNFYNKMISGLLIYDWIAGPGSIINLKLLYMGPTGLLDCKQIQQKLFLIGLFELQSHIDVLPNNNCNLSIVVFRCV